MKDSINFPVNAQISQVVLEELREFLGSFLLYEVEQGTTPCLFLDEKSGAFYLTCHLPGRVLSQYCDTEATIEGYEEDEIYKLNRDIMEDKTAFKTMEEDASRGRSFEDIVLEYDTSYKPKRPLKVYGGQHRIRAITKAESTKGYVLHGVRVYFGLSREQKVEIATVNNTAIAVPNDLLDRMREQLLGSELRDWCQQVGLLGRGEDFADRRRPDIPTVRVARTLLVNFYLGKDAADDAFLQPVLCKSGGVDEDYMGIRHRVDWSDSALLEMGKQFARLHKTQRERILERDEDSDAEFARKALTHSVVASWGFAAGFFQRDPQYLQSLYAIPGNVNPPDDPLNAKALSQARLKGTDPDTYRGLGTRSSPQELGRMLEVFLILATKGKKRITKEIANAAIQSYEAKRAVNEANKVLRRI